MKIISFNVEAGGLGKLQSASILLPCLQAKDFEFLCLGQIEA